MNIKTLMLHVLTCLVAVIYSFVYGQNTSCCQNCCDNICKYPTPYNVTLEELVSMQPLYVVFYPLIPVYAGDDNVCFTLSPLPDGTYLLTISRVYTIYYNTTKCITVAMETPGVILAGSATNSIRLIVFDLIQTEDCSVYFVYTCFDYGKHMFQCGNDIPVYGLSTRNTPISSACLASVADLISKDGLPSQRYLTLPMNLPSGCKSEVCSI